VSGIDQPQGNWDKLARLRVIAPLVLPLEHNKELTCIQLLEDLTATGATKPSNYSQTRDESFSTSTALRILGW